MAESNTTSLSRALRRPATPNEIASHLADRISALEQNQRIARENGDGVFLSSAAAEIRRIRTEALKHGLTPDSHPGLFK